MSGAAPGRKADRNYPGCPDRLLASPARLGCALRENGKSGAEDHNVTAADRRGHGSENGLKSQGPGAWSLTDQLVRSGVDADRKGNEPKEIRTSHQVQTPLSSFIGGKRCIDIRAGGCRRLSSCCSRYFPSRATRLTPRRSATMAASAQGAGWSTEYRAHPAGGCRLRG